MHRCRQYTVNLYSTERHHAPPLHPQPLPPGPLLVNAFTASVQAGFPSPAEDHQVERIDLMNQLIKHPQATFMLRVSGQSMRDAGILDGSVVDGDFTCKTLQTGPNGFRLVAANPDFPDIVLTEGQTIEVWGVVVASIVQHGA